MPVVGLSLNSKDAVAGLKQYDQAIDKSEKNTDSAFAKMKGHVATFSAMVAGAVAAIGASMLTVGALSLDSASRMQEASNKYAVVFEGMTGQADVWRKNLEDNYNLSGLAATKYLSNTKAILDATGMQSQAAGELSNNMVKLALDLASFSDVPIEDAIQATTAALTGEMEMMKRFGVVIKAEEINQRAMVDNNYRAAASVTEADKAQAAYNIMLEKGAKAIGDVSRSSESYVTQLNILKKTYDNVNVAIGNQLIPLATQALRIFNEWNGTNDTATVAANAFNTALKYVVNTVQFLYNGFQGLVMIGNFLVVGMANMADKFVSALQLMIIPMNAIGDALVRFKILDENPFKGVIAGINEMRESSQAFLESSKATLDAQLVSIEKTNKGFDDMGKAIDSTRVATEKMTEATKAQDSVADAMLTSTVAAASGVKQYGNALDMVKGKGEGYVRTGAAVKTMTTQQATEFNKLYSAAESARAAYEKQVATLTAKSTPAAHQYAASLKKIADDADEALKKHIDMPPAIEKTAEAMDKAGVSAENLSKKYRDASSSARSASDEFNSMSSDLEDDSSDDMTSGGKTKAAGISGSFDAKGGLSEEQWKSLPKDVRDRLAKQALTDSSSTFDYFNSPTGQRFKGVDPALQIATRNQFAYQFEGLKAGNQVTINNNFNQQISRSDVAGIMEETQRSAARA
jgi:hypothetical protein